METRRPPLWWILLRHEWRLTLRSFGSFGSFGAFRRGPGAKPRKVRGRTRVVVNYMLAGILLHLLGLVTLAMPRHWHDTQFERIAAIAALAFLFTSTLSAA
ncbi:MAG: hypothetical protein ABI277_07395, partial [Burkholderiaceae bacterium]